MGQKKYITPNIRSQKIKLNHFFRADHWYGDIDQFFIKEAHAQGSGSTIWLPIIIAPGGGGGSGGGGGGS